MIIKKIGLSLLISLCLCTIGHTQSASDSLNVAEKNASAWFIALPLRFTQIQSTNTMFSGVKLGYEWNSRWRSSLSVYHTFYLNTFRPKANIVGPSAEEHPRLLMYSVGLELEYALWRKKSYALWMQLYSGWGFLEYKSTASHFSSSTSHYWALEPVLLNEWSNKKGTAFGLGLGYRPLWASHINYQSNWGNGQIEVENAWPNGLLLMLSIRGNF